MHRKLYNQYKEATCKRNKDNIKLVIFGNFNPQDFNFAEIYPFNGEYFTDKSFDAIICTTNFIPKELYDLSILYHISIFHLTKDNPSVSIDDIIKSKFLKLQKQ